MGRGLPALEAAVAAAVLFWQGAGFRTGSGLSVPDWSCSFTNPTSQRSLRVVARIGHGVEGSVYKAVGENVVAAVKVPHAGGAGDDSLSDFWREARAMERISALAPRAAHLNALAPGFEDQHHFDCCGRTCLVQEFVDGAPVHERFNGCRDDASSTGEDCPRGSLSYEALRVLLLQSLTAFLELHRACLSNSDQHLKNVMLSEDPVHVTFVDFGLATESAILSLENFKEDGRKSFAMQPPFPWLADLLPAAVKKGKKKRGPAAAPEATAFRELCRQVADLGDEAPKDPKEALLKLVDRDLQRGGRGFLAYQPMGPDAELALQELREA